MHFVTPHHWFYTEISISTARVIIWLQLLDPKRDKTEQSPLTNFTQKQKSLSVVGMLLSKGNIQLKFQTTMNQQVITSAITSFLCWAWLQATHTVCLQKAPRRSSSKASSVVHQLPWQDLKDKRGWSLRNCQAGVTSPGMIKHTVIDLAASPSAFCL